MKTVLISIGASLGIAGVIVGSGIALSRGSGTSPPATELAVLHQEISGLREEIQGLAGEIRNLNASQQALAGGLGAWRSAANQESAPEGGDAVPATASNLDSGGLTESVALVIAEERKIQEAERQRQREEMRQRLEERRQEQEAMRQGPYDRYNLKVNSLAKKLGLSEAQKQTYFDLATAHRARFEEGMKQLREARSAENPGTGENDESSRRGRGPGGARGPGGGADREKYRELADTLQKSFDASLQAMLTAEQQAAYAGLSRSSQSYLDLDMVSSSSEGGGSRFGGQRGFSTGGFGGGPGGRGAFGGGPGGGGGRPGR